MAIDYTVITEELVAGHPVTGAYSADAQTAAEQFNALNISGTKPNIEGSTMWAATSTTEFGALSNEKKAEWLAFCGIESHDPVNNGLAHRFVNYIFGGGSETLQELAFIRSTSVSRAAQLGLKELKRSHIQVARGEI